MNGEYLFFYGFTVLVAVIAWQSLVYVTSNLGRGESLISFLWALMLFSAILFWWHVAQSTYADEYAINLLILWMESFND